jgi:hypothetical protein
MHQRLFILLLIVLVSCSPNPEGEQSSNKVEQVDDGNRYVIVKETFDEFYRGFSSDSAYQVSRIIFPLIVETYDLDTEQFVLSAIDQKEWEFMNFGLKKPYDLEIQPAEDTVRVNIQIEETGVVVDYLFAMVDNRWMLVKVVDQST